MRKKDILGNFVKKKDVIYNYAIKKIDGEDEVYSAIINFMPGCRDLIVDYEGSKCQLAGNGYKWLMYLPLKEFWCITAFYSPQNELLEWYFDISKGNFLDENGMPCIDDMFLDLVIMPDARAITVDADELQEALDNNVITPNDFSLAYQIHAEILNSKWNDVNLLTLLCNKLMSEF